MRLIDADELRLLAIEKLHMVNPLGDITDLIDEAPTIEPSGDLISRQDAIEMAVDVETPQGTYERAIYVDDLMALPSADRPKGEWLDVEHEPYCECSVCGAYIENLDDDFAFCPRCGADMRPEK